MGHCGIDFGTSNSALALVLDKKVVLSEIENGSATLPSALFYPHAKPPVFGRAAQKLFFESEEGRFMRSLKRILGTPLMAQGTVVNGKLKKFEDIIGDFITFLKTRAEKQAGFALSSVVVGRPVHFIDGNPDGDKAAERQLEDIVRKTGFKNVSFQFEPIAAAFAHERDIAGEKLALVVDIGGGTSDFTVIRVGKTLCQKPDRSGDILGNAGVRIGGNDFDKDLSLAAFMPHFGMATTYGEKNLVVPLSPFHDLSEWSKVNFLYTPKFRQEMKNILKESHDFEKFSRYVKIIQEETGHKVLSAVEDMKISLTANENAKVRLGFVDDSLEISATRKLFDQSIKQEAEKISATIADCLANAGVQKNQIELVILTGGPTETPLLKTLVHTRFPTAQISEENKLSSVALGLGYDSRRKFGDF